MNNTPVSISTLHMSREEWLEQRRKGIGGSDAPKILGYSKYAGPLTVYMDKLGELPPVETGEAAYWGIALEDLVASEFARREGVKVRRKNQICSHPEHPWMLANVDRVIVGRNQGLECKTASAYLAEEWEGEKLPTAYYVQIQHYCAVMGWEGCWVAALIGGQRFTHKYVPRNETDIQTIISGLKDFWEGHVLPGIPPEAEAFDNPAIVYPIQQEEDMLEPDQEAMDLHDQLLRIEAVIEEAETEKKRLQGLLQVKIGDHAGIDGLCTWKQVKGKTSWKNVALELGATEELAEKHRGKGSRRFLTIKKKSLEEAV